MLIGQGTEYYPYIYEHVGLLPWMYDSIAFLRSRKPREIASFETITRPLEPSLWAITIGFTFLVFMSLYTFQKLWSNLTGQQFRQDQIFQGNPAQQWRKELRTCVKNLCFTDLSLAFIFMKKVPPGWFRRDGFTHSKKLLLIFWLVMGNFILKGYSSTLLSNLVRIDYEKTIESYDDADKSGLKFLVPIFEGFLEEFISGNPYLSRMVGKFLRYPFEDFGSPWYEER